MAKKLKVSVEVESEYAEIVLEMLRLVKRAMEYRGEVVKFKIKAEEVK